MLSRGQNLTEIKKNRQSILLFQIGLTWASVRTWHALEDVIDPLYRLKRRLKLDFVRLGGEAQCVRHADEARRRNYLRFAVRRGV
jgi:hypothetical protein